MNEHDRWLADIIARPWDDEPRLMFADWLAENATSDSAEFTHFCDGLRTVKRIPGNGYAARAEFIRVQCELAKLAREKDDLLGDEETDWRLCDSESSIAASWCPNCGDCCCPNRENALDDPACPLHNRDSKHCRLSTIADRIDALRRREREIGEKYGEQWIKEMLGVK